MGSLFSFETPDQHIVPQKVDVVSQVDQQEEIDNVMSCQVENKDTDQLIKELS